MRGGNLKQSKSVNAKPETTPTSLGSNAKSPGIVRRVRSFAGRMSMGLSIYFAWLAVKAAPWLFRPTSLNPKGKPNE
jgi:hypothetical protein